MSIFHLVLLSIPMFFIPFDTKMFELKDAIHFVYGASFIRVVRGGIMAFGM